MGNKWLTVGNERHSVIGVKNNNCSDPAHTELIDDKLFK